MHVEYKGQADYQVGTGIVHEVRAFWTAGRDEPGTVKRAASAAVRKEVGKGGSVTFESWDMDTYNSPSLAAIVRVRVLTDEQVAARKELRERVYDKCELCDTASASEVVELKEDGTEHAMCYSCRRGLQGPYQVKHWINKHGKVQIN